MALTATPADLTPADRSRVRINGGKCLSGDGCEQFITVGKTIFRIHRFDGAKGQNLSLVLPIDELLSVRLTAAQRLSQALSGRKPDADPARWTRAQRARHVLILRALDARLDGTTYRDIAAVLFGSKRVSERSWKTHDLRGRTIGLVRRGTDLMQGGYRQLLLYPFRERRF